MYFTHPQFKIFSLKSPLRSFSEINLRNKLAKIFPNYYILFTDSGRSAFRLAVQSLNLEDSEMIIPAYICDIFEPILESFNIKPIYLDVDLDTFHADLTDIESKITPNTKSILICHTYGLPVEMDKILGIAKKYNLKIIEDCAHMLFGLPRAESRGDALFFSFAKLLPVINGGMLVSKKPINTKLENYRFKLANLIKFLRLSPMLASCSEKFRSERLTLNSNAFSNPQKASHLSLKMFDNYLENLPGKIEKRIELARYYQKKLANIGFEVQESQNNTFTYLSALAPKNINRNELFNKLRKRHIFCSRIWHNPLFNGLPGTSEASKRIINFPLQSWFIQKDVDKIIKILKTFISS